METTLSFSDPRDRKTYYFHATLFRRILIPILDALFRLFIRVEVRGLEHMPLAGPAILACNHLTNFDVFPISFNLPRTVFFMGKEELFRNPVLDWSFRQLGGFPVYRGAADSWAIRHAHQVLERDQVLGIFPEGKRSKAGGLKPAKNGAARLALASCSPVVPMAIYGTQHILRRFPRRVQVTISLGNPVYPQPDENPLDLTGRIMFAIAEMLPATARGSYARQD